MATSKDDVRVVCRFRPQNRMEKEKGKGCAVETEDGIAWLTSQKNRHRFDFDHVFGVDSDQESVFNSTAASMVTDSLKGYNSTIYFACKTLECRLCEQGLNQSRRWSNWKWKNVHDDGRERKPRNYPTTCQFAI